MGLFRFLFGPRQHTEATDAEAVDKAVRLIQRRKLDSAETLLRDVLGRVPPEYRRESEVDGELHIRFWDAEEFLAYVAWMQERKAERAVVWIGNAYARAAFYLGYIAIERGDLDEAVRRLDAGLKLEPGSVKLAHEKAQAFLRQGRLEEASAIYEGQLARDGFMSPAERGVLLRGRGYIQIERGELELAEATYRESLTVDPDSPTAQNQLAYIEACRRKDPPGQTPILWS